MKSALLAIPPVLVGGRARLSRNAYTPAITRGFIVVNILADALCGAGDDAVALLVPQREIDWQPTVFWVWPTVRFWRRRWRGAYGCLYEKLACQYCQLKHTGRSRLRRLFSWWLLGENPGAVEGSGIG